MAVCMGAGFGLFRVACSGQIGVGIGRSLGGFSCTERRKYDQSISLLLFKSLATLAMIG